MMFYYSIFIQIIPPIPTNLTIVTEFILMGCSTNKNICIFHLVLFFLIYFCALMGNVLIIMTTTLGQNIHTPMYCFLKKISFGDLWLISATIPKSIANSLSHTNSISFTSCVAQVSMLFFFQWLQNYSSWW